MRVLLMSFRSGWNHSQKRLKVFKFTVVSVLIAAVAAPVGWLFLLGRALKGTNSVFSDDSAGPTGSSYETRSS